MKKIKRLICLVGIVLLGLQLSACEMQKAEAKENETEMAAETKSSGEEESMDPALVWKQAAAALEEGNCYEITENPYIEGIDFDFSKEDIQSLREIFHAGEAEYSHMVYEPEKAKYIINFYDKKENCLVSFSQMEDGKLYMDGGYQVICRDLEDLFHSRIEKKKNGEKE